MKKIIEEIVKLDKLVPGGQAMGKLADGRKVFVWGGLPGEQVKIRLTKLKKSYAEAVTTEVLHKSNQRIRPCDECYLSTSPWQIMAEDYELEQKSQLVNESFRQEGVDLPEKPIKTDGKFYHYRNKMEYSLWWDHDTARIWPAFHKRGSHQKILVRQSSIERPEIWQQAQTIIDELNTNGDEARNYQSLMIRCNQQGQTSGGLFRMNQPHPRMEQLSDAILGNTYSYSPNGFFQINIPVYELALTEMKPYITTKKVVDMYSGVGTIGLSIARDHDLTLVETDSHAYAELQHNIPKGSTNITGVHAKSEEALEYITGDATVIVDPPRAGLDDRVVGRILEATPPTVIYLSCNPATQARDVAKLASKYRIIHNQSFNFFPRTPHIENLVVLQLDIAN